MNLSDINLNNMNAKDNDKIDIKEHKQQLSILDSEIEKALKELENLNERSKNAAQQATTSTSATKKEHSSPSKRSIHYYGGQADPEGLNESNSSRKQSNAPLSDNSQLSSENFLLHSSSLKSKSPFDKENARKPPQSARKMTTPKKSSIGEMSGQMLETFSRTPLSARPEHRYNQSSGEAKTQGTPKGQVEDYFEQHHKKTAPQRKDSSGLRIEDRLLLLGKQREQRLKKLQQSEEKKTKEQANRRKPSLGKSTSPSSARENLQNTSPRRASSPISGLHRLSSARKSSSKTGNVNELFKQGEITEEEEEAHSDNQHKKENTNRSPQKKASFQIEHNRSPSDRRESRSPKFSPNRESSPPSNVIELLFSGRGDTNYPSIRNLTPVERVYLASKNVTFHPQISRKSQEIASKLGDPLERVMHSNIHKIKESKKAELIEKAETELLFRPKINRVSQILDDNFRQQLFGQDQLHRWDQLYLMKDKYQIELHMKKLEKERKEMEMDECTFHPNINKSGSYSHREYKGNFADRAHKWQERKDKKISKERDMQVTKELEECTFKPKLTTMPPNKMGASISAVNLFDNSHIYIRGLDQHYERVDLVNRRKREKEAKLTKHSGKEWKNQITIPQEFNFHYPGNIADSSYSPLRSTFKSPVKGTPTAKGTPRATINSSARRSSQPQYSKSPQARDNRTYYAVRKSPGPVYTEETSNETYRYHNRTSDTSYVGKYPQLHDYLHRMEL